MVTNEAIPQHRLLFITCALFKFRVHQHAPCTSFQFLKRGESLTYDIGESLTYGRGVTQTDFWGLATAIM